MSKEIFDDRRRGLEESFFAKHNRQLLEAMRHKTEAQARREDLQTVAGIKDEKLLDELVALELDAAGMAALALVPLLQVAWADGQVQSRERDAVLDAADKAGVRKDSPGYELLAGWIDRAPDPRMFQAWKNYVKGMRGVMSDDSILALRTEVLARAKAVARAAGGILGVGGTVGSEQRVLDELEKAFEA